MTAPPHSPGPDPSVARLCRWVLHYAAKRRGPLTGVLISMLLQVGLDVLKPWPMVFLIDHVLQSQGMPNWLAALVTILPGSHTAAALVAWSVGATVLLFLLSWAVGLANAYGNISLGQRMVYDLAGDLFARLQQLSLRFHTGTSVGDNIRRVTADCACVSTILKDALLPAVSSAISLAAMFLIMWRIDSSLTLLALVVVPYMMLIFQLYARPMMEGSYEQQQIEARIYEITEQTFSAIPAVQAFGREELNDARFKLATRDTVAATISLTKLQMRFRILIGFATAAGTSGILWFGTRHALEGRLTVGAIVLFLAYLASLYAPLAAIIYTSSTIQGAAGSARRVWEVLESKLEVRDKPQAIALKSARGHVQFEQVTFGYAPERPVIRDISLEIHPGETIALVGATGAGKSTLLSLVPRFFDPWEGRVLVDGQAVRDLQLKSLRNSVALVLQEPFLFPLSIADNIAYGRLQASSAEIETAARSANAHEFIQRLPRGYQTVIGERGDTLSAGERQRLSIARALLKNAPILILDEPTSALDAETESLLMQALERLTSGRSTLIIAHRLSTARRAHRIVVLEEGRIAESGTHEQLLRQSGIYARFSARAQ